MLFSTATLAVGWLDITWHFLGVLLVLVSLFMILVIMIQDSKGAGLTSAFGAGPGGESLLGARMQRDVARWTAYAGLVFATLVIAMVILGNIKARTGSIGAAGASAETAPPTAPAPGVPGLAPLGGGETGEGTPSPAPLGPAGEGGASPPAAPSTPPSSAATSSPPAPPGGAAAPAAPSQPTPEKK